jgi:UDPglucose 6-dehydrogenase
MNIVMVGSGYVGLVSGACFADLGHTVTCVDKDSRKIDALRAGRIPIYEPGLAELVDKNAKAGRLSFTTELAGAAARADAIFIAVGTPSRKSDGHADLSYVYDAAREIAGAVSGFTVIVTKSTVPVGTGDDVERIIRETNADADVAVASNPEFLREGAAIPDFMNPDRIVVGLNEPRAEAVMEAIYKPLTDKGAPLMMMSRRTSELTKYANNALLAMKITFINEVADLCERVGADVRDVAKGIGSDERIGPKFLQAGPGYGGSCFPKDTLALAKTAQDFDSPLRLIETLVAINDNRKRQMARKIIQAAGGDVRGKTICVLGLTFKPNTDDMREAPSLSIVQALRDQGATIRAYDPEGMEHARLLMPDIVFCADPYAAAEGASATALITEWEEFKSLDFARLRSLVASPMFVDLRNVYRPDEVSRHGFTIVGVGRKA